MAMVALLQGASFREAGRIIGCDHKQITKWLRNDENFLRVFQYSLFRRGIDYQTIADGLAGATEATEPRWNPKAERWEHFPDNKTRLRAAETLCKLLDLYPKTARAAGLEGQIQIAVITNFGSDDREQEGEFVVDVPSAP